MYFEADAGPSATADFKSPDLQTKREICSVRFYYYMYGADVGSLTVSSQGLVAGEVTTQGVSPGYRCFRAG